MRAETKIVRVEQSVEMAKRQLRRSIRQQRQNQPQAKREQSREQLAKNALALFAQLGTATQICCYLSAEHEPDTGEILQQFFKRNIPILLPVSQSDKTLAWEYYHPDLEVVARSGMPEPRTISPELRPNAETLMLIPAAASDTKGNRLGWGGGYYDRTLASTPENAGVFAVLNDDEMLSHIPVSSHDHPISGAVTPSTIYYANPVTA